MGDQGLQFVRHFKRRVRREFPEEPTDEVFARFDERGDGLDRKALRRLLEYISLALDGDQLKYLRKVISPTSKVISYEVRCNQLALCGFAHCCSVAGLSGVYEPRAHVGGEERRSDDHC